MTESHDDSNGIYLDVVPALRSVRLIRCAGALLGILVALAPPLPARADTGDDATSGSPKRAVPAYDGRDPPPRSITDDLLGVPRLLLAPPYLVNEYVLRRPLSVAIPAAEASDFFTKAYDFFLFAPGHKGGILPIGFVEFDFNPSVGIYAFWDDAGFKGNDLALHMEAWPTDWFAGNLTHRVRFAHGQAIQFRLSEVHRPDKLFFGVGPTTLESSESRYALQGFEGDVSYEWQFWRSSRVQASVGVRDVRVSDGSFGDDPSVTVEAATGAFALPMGFGVPYTAEHNRLIAAIDTRVPEARRGSGVRFELDLDEGNDAHDAPLSGWIRYGATATGYLDLTGHRRVIALSVAAEMADSVGPGELPFTELVSLGGDHLMRGFYSGRLLGESAAVATASYSWPIAPWIDGDLQLALGNVFGEHLSGLDARLLRFSGAMGFSLGGSAKNGVMGSEDAPLELLLGIGSETFEQGGQVDAVRVMAGVPVSF